MPDRRAIHNLKQNQTEEFDMDNDQNQQFLYTFHLALTC